MSMNDYQGSEVAPPVCSKCSKKFESMGWYLTCPMPPRIIINAGPFTLQGDLQPDSISLRSFNTDQSADRHEFQWLATVAVKQENEIEPAGVGFFHKSHSAKGGIWQFDPMLRESYQPSDAKIREIEAISPKWRPVLIILEQKPAPGRWSYSEHLAHTRGDMVYRGTTCTALCQWRGISLQKTDIA